MWSKTLIPLNSYICLLLASVQMTCSVCMCGREMVLFTWDERLTSVSSNMSSGAFRNHQEQLSQQLWGSCQRKSSVKTVWRAVVITRHLWRLSSQVVKRSFINACESALAARNHRRIISALRWAESTYREHKVFMDKRQTHYCCKMCLLGT